MIGLVFGFFIAVCLLVACLAVLGFLFESGLIWPILGGFLILIIVIFAQSAENNRKWEAERPARVARCKQQAGAVYSRYPATARNYAIYQREIGYCSL